MRTSTLLGAYAAALVVLLVQGEAAANIDGIGKIYRFTGCATDVWGRPTAGVSFQLLCYRDHPTKAEDGKATNGWTRVGTSVTGSNGCVTISVQGQNTIASEPVGGYIDATYCHWRRESDDRMLHWPGVNGNPSIQTGVPSFSQTNAYNAKWPGAVGNYPGVVTFSNLASANNVPAAKHVKNLATGANLVLFQSVDKTQAGTPDSAYDKPVLLLDGFDPSNARSAFSMWSQTTAAKQYMEQGWDIWFFNSKDGATSLRTHGDQLAYAIVYVKKHNGLGKIPNVSGFSEGGIDLRVALAGWEHVRHYGGTAPSWFTFGQTVTSGSPAAADGYAVGSNPAVSEIIPLRTAVAVDSPLLGIVAAPRLLQTTLWKVVNGEITCHLPWWARALSATTGLVLSAAGVPVLGAPFLVGVLLSSKINTTLPMAKTMLEAASFKDGMREYCPNSNWLFCTTAYHDAFYAELDSLNGNGGWPKRVKFVGVSQADWAPNHTTMLDQWGPGTASHVHAAHTDNETAFFADLPSGCPDFTIPAVASHGDLEPGSVSDFVKDILALVEDQANGHGTVTAYFMPVYQSTKDALAMTGPTAVTRLHDVMWQNDILTHQDIANPGSGTPAFVSGYLIADADGDRYVDCNAFGVSRYAGTRFPGKLCTCDPNDTDPNLTGTCFGTAADAIDPSCVNNVGSACDGADPDVCQEGTVQCGGTCSDTTGTTTCSDLGKNCGSISDGCGGTLTCGSCTSPQTCGGGGVANVCAAPPLTANGQSCTAASQCASGYCYPGPQGVSYCIAATSNCAQPGTAGVLYGQTYVYNAVTYLCQSPGVVVACAAGFGSACDGADGDLCREGTVQCDGTCSDATATNKEWCADNIDNDCDGSIDEAGCFF